MALAFDKSLISDSDEDPSKQTAMSFISTIARIQISEMFDLAGTRVALWDPSLIADPEQRSMELQI
jgi:hypothetical protein